MTCGFILFGRKDCLDIDARIVPGEKKARLLTWSGTPEAGALLLGRLHYVDAFRARWHSPEAGPDRSQAATVLAAYRAAGRAALEHVEGEFSLVVWDQHENMVFALRDPLGSYPLYWAQRGSDFAVATGIAPLTEFLGSAAIDIDYLADYHATINPNTRKIDNPERKQLRAQLKELTAERDRQMWEGLQG